MTDNDPFDAASSKFSPHEARPMPMAGDQPLWGGPMPPPQGGHAMPSPPPPYASAGPPAQGMEEPQPLLVKDANAQGLLTAILIFVIINSLLLLFLFITANGGPL